MKILVTGGAGFIGSAVCRLLVKNPETTVINVDKLTYAGNLQSLRAIENAPNYKHYCTDICDEDGILTILRDENINSVMHLAAESHVDRSINGPAAFIETNVVGTFRMLSASLTYWRGLTDAKKEEFRFHHVSTDEVFGDLPFDTSMFTETTAYAPSSPYSASKAASDHFVRAWHKTYGLPVVLSNCSNNYGPFHFPEKLIPLIIINALHERPLPIYGDGGNVRDWLFVEDHAKALEVVLKQGRSGESYNIGGYEEKTNLSVVETICKILDEKRPRSNGQKYAELITYIADRPGHDRRYAIDASKIKSELGWLPKESFNSGIDKTITWYLDNTWWWQPLYEKSNENNRLSQAK
ncbi:dTDP-glucose 4,6-dehydratase [Pseudochrobactrum sp. MP213Fo]|uniref:dTDP-glucose 4,6-dehydratase n=1 Tax=Pseudochrobactrum sp. MP213Fo TaxID=3022250 RepID=UPI003BA2321E